MIQGLVRGIFLGIDKVIYRILAALFTLILNLSSFELFSNEIIKNFRNRIYLILGLIMVFKLMTSFIQILVNPDSMNDKEKGLGGILRRVIVSLLLIVFVPEIFNMARDLQKRILPIIPKVVLATPVDLGNDEVSTSAGQTMAYYTFLSFFYYANDNCNYGTLLGTSNTTSANPISSVEDITDDMVKEKKCPDAPDGFTYRYQYFISSVVGAFMIYVLVMIAIDVAKRTIKLAICEIIAPIPIATYIDPKLSKQSFDNWVNTTVKVYISLFVDLISVYFVIYVFTLLFNGDNTILDSTLGKYGTANGFFVILFIIIALVMFAKEIPKFISGMLGLKDGFSDIGAIFKGAGALAAASTGAALGGIGNGLNSIRTRDKIDKNASLTSKIGTVGSNIARGIGSTTAGFTSGLYHGSRDAITGKSAKDAWTNSTQGTWTRRQNRVADNYSGATTTGRIGVAVKDYFQFTDDVSLSEGILKDLNAVHSDVGNSKKATFGRIDKDGRIGFHGGHEAGKSDTIQQLGELMYNNYDPSKPWKNQELLNYMNKLDYTVDSDGKRQWFIKKGESMGYHDLTAIARNAEQSGVGSLASALGDNGYLKLGAQKEIHANTVSGNATTSDGNVHTSFMQNPDIVTARENAHADITRMAGNLAGIEFKGRKLNTVEELIKAYDEDQAKFDDAIQARMQQINSKVSSNADAVNRAANQRWKNSNKK